jgi:YD repeat-containing protein
MQVAAGGHTSLNATISQTTYDALGGVLSQKDALNNTTTDTYDGFHQLASQTDANGTGTTSYTYDLDGDLASEIDPDGTTTNYVYNALDELTSQSETVAEYQYVATVDGEPTTETHTVTATTAYLYDADGNLTQKTDADGNVTDFSYDALNRETGELW